MIEIGILTAICWPTALLTGFRLYEAVKHHEIMTYVESTKKSDSPKDFWFLSFVVLIMFVFSASLALLGSYLLLEHAI